MDQDATWYGSMPWPRPHCDRWGPSSPNKKGGTPPIFGPCLLWASGWMDQDTTLYEGRPRPSHIVQHFPKKGTAAIFGPCLLWPNGLMDQYATWYGGRPRPRPHCVTWLTPKGHSAQFSAHIYCGQTVAHLNYC